MSHTFDILKARAETRSADAILHFNNAGSSLMPIPVADALYTYLQREEQIGGYETAEEYAEQLENFYHAAARMLNCHPDEIAFIENATRAWDMAFYALSFKPGDRILTTIEEYGSNVIAYLQQAQRTGVSVTFLPNDEHGQLDVAALANEIDDSVKLIALSHVPTGSGLVQPLAAVGRIARAAGIPFLVDACQSLGQLNVDVEALGCDMLSSTGRKYLRGPRGTGLLYVRREWIERLDPPMIDQYAADLISPTQYVLRKDARRFENWERYFAGQVGLGVAIDYANNWGLDAIEARVNMLATMLRSRLSTIDGVTVTDQGEKRCGIVTARIDGHSAVDIKMALREHGINVSVSSGSGNLVGYTSRGLTETVRSSVHYYNTEAEIERYVTTLQTILHGS